MCIYIYINIIIGWLGLGTTGTADDCIPLASHQWPKGFGSAIMSSSRKSPNHILLEDVVNTWLNSSEDKIPMIRENEAGCRSGWVCIVSVEAWLNVWLEERHYWSCSEIYIYIYIYMIDVKDPQGYTHTICYIYVYIHACRCNINKINMCWRHCLVQNRNMLPVDKNGPQSMEAVSWQLGCLLGCCWLGTGCCFVFMLDHMCM